MVETRLGKISVDGTIGQRDAFHIPAVLVVSDDQLEAGCPVRFTDKYYNKVKFSSRANAHAIVDPYLIDLPKNNQRFWVWLLPDITRQLSHNFTIDIPELQKTEIDYDDENYYPDYQTDECRWCD